MGDKDNDNDLNTTAHVHATVADDTIRSDYNDGNDNDDSNGDSSEDS